MALEVDHERLLRILGIVGLLVFAYSLIIEQAVLVGVFLLAVLSALYLFFVLIQVLDRIATALELFVEQNQRDETADNR